MRRILFVNASISWVSWVVRMMVVPWSLLISRIILRTAIFETASVVPAKAAGHDFNGTAFSGAVGTYIAHDFTLTDMKGDILQRWRVSYSLWNREEKAVHRPEFLRATRYVLQICSTVIMFLSSPESLYGILALNFYFIVWIRDCQ